MVCELGVVPPLFTVMVPVWLPGARFAVFTDTLSATGVVPLVGVTSSQAALSETVNGRAAPVLPIWTVWGAGVDSPIRKAKASEFELTVIVAAACTVSVTFTV